MIYLLSNDVKRKISNLVAEEERNKVYSDQELCDILCSQHNIIISRRTVAKYREELQIATSAVRKKQKRIL